ncbi:TPA: hypothetical protein IHM15_004877, partial [Escherichia coli]|nr:hypothetical protein [Escherichia coli]
MPLSVHDLKCQSPKVAKVRGVASLISLAAEMAQTPSSSGSAWAAMVARMDA